MMARRTFGRGVMKLVAGGAALATMLGLSGCGQIFPNTYRFRMTVEVETPGGIKTGSSVYEVSAGNTGAILPDAAKRSWAVKGEAVAVDLGAGQVLFSLLKTGAHFGDLGGLSMNALHPDFREGGYDVVGVAKELASGGYPGPADVTASDYPMLVTFTDINDPTSVALVDPANLAASFGEGVALKRITVEVTEDEVTTGIDERLGWLLDPNRKRFEPNNKPQGIPLGNYRGLFSTELPK